MKNLTAGQWLGIILAVLGVLAASTVQLTDLFGPSIAKTIGTVANLLMTTLSSILVVITGQAAQLQAVQAMPGVEKITVNARANETLATLAVDPAQPKIEPLPQAAAAVQRAAQSN